MTVFLVFLLLCDSSHVILKSNYNESWVMYQGSEGNVKADAIFEE
jgi:hypothetical protein